MIHIRPMTAKDFEHFWPTFQAVVQARETYSFDPPLKLTANTALAYDASAATTTLTISANGFKSKV